MSRVIQTVWLVILAFVGLGIYSFFYCGFVEERNLVWPHIDTEFAKDFRQNEWHNVHLGMRKPKVKALLGAPLTSGESIWVYSQERRRFKKLDYAWEYFALEFNNNDNVTKILRRWYYD